VLRSRSLDEPEHQPVYVTTATRFRHTGVRVASGYRPVRRFQGGRDRVRCEPSASSGCAGRAAAACRVRDPATAGSRRQRAEKPRRRRPWSPARRSRTAPGPARPPRQVQRGRSCAQASAPAEPRPAGRIVPKTAGHPRRDHPGAIAASIRPGIPAPVRRRARGHPHRRISRARCPRRPRPGARGRPGGAGRAPARHSRSAGPSRAPGTRRRPVPAAAHAAGYTSSSGRTAPVVADHPGRRAPPALRARSRTPPDGLQRWRAPPRGRCTARPWQHAPARGERGRGSALGSVGRAPAPAARPAPHARSCAARMLLGPGVHHRRAYVRDAAHARPI